MIIVTKQSIKRKYSSQSIRQLVNKKKQRRMSPFSIFMFFHFLSYSTAYTNNKMEEKAKNLW
jgi:hypothetical protein